MCFFTRLNQQPIDFYVPRPLVALTFTSSTLTSETTMTFDEFSLKLGSAVTPGMIFVNPGGGTSEVVSLDNGKISYRRKSLTITITIRSLYDAFFVFRNSRISSPDLKARWPAIFDPRARPAGHSCNVTFLFLCLKKMGIVSEILGKGVRGNPYYVELCSR
jgi:hypothetical protein